MKMYKKLKKKITKSVIQSVIIHYKALTAQSVIQTMYNNIKNRNE